MLATRSAFLAFAVVLSVAACAANRDPVTSGMPAIAGAQNDAHGASPARRKPARMYVADRDGNAILGFLAKDGGNVPPRMTIAGSKTRLHAPVALAADAQGNFYCANDASREVLIFPAGSNGNAKPAVLGGSNVPLKATEGIAIDASGQIYVSDYQRVQILVFAPGAAGNTAPIRTISGRDTGLTVPTGLAFDGAGNLYVANYSALGATIVEFAPDADGDAAPIGMLGIAGGGGKSDLYGTFNVSVNAAGDVIVPNNVIPGIEVFKHGARGDIKPNATIEGPATGIGYISSAGLDDDGDLYVTNVTGTGSDQVLVWGARAKGNVAPVRVFGGPHTELLDPFYPTII